MRTGIATRIAVPLLLGLLASLVGAPACRADARPAPMRHGVCFFCPDKEDEAIRQLELLKREGFDLIEFASWVWTLPTPGSALERRARAVLDWCDTHDVAFFLMHNIQWGSPGEGGGLNDQVLHPEKAAPLVEDWARVLRGHRCVIGVILGNEVGPSLGTPQEAPELWRQFRDWLGGQHGSIESLNAAWRTKFADLGDVGVPPEQSPGWADYRRYAHLRFAQFYGALFDGAFRPVLGAKLYGNKTSLDPFLHRACQRMTMTCWDDLMAQYPLWQIKCAADTTGRPLFNAELHLYNDEYEYFPSPEASRYRYFMSALTGEYMTASYAWGQWNKPQIRRVHQATPRILADLRRVEQECRALAAAYQRANLAVLVTEENFYRGHIDRTSRHPLAILYACMSALGRPWRYVLEDDLGSFKRGTLVVWTRGLKPTAARALAGLPPGVLVVAIDAVPQADEYGRPLTDELQRKLRERLQVVPQHRLTAVIGVQPGLPSEYQRLADVSYLWWSNEKGHYRYVVPYCAIEARWAKTPAGLLLALVNNTQQAQSAPLPWVGGYRVVDLATGRELAVPRQRRLRFAPLDVKLFLLKRR